MVVEGAVLLEIGVHVVLSVANVFEAFFFPLVVERRLNDGDVCVLCVLGVYVAVGAHNAHEVGQLTRNVVLHGESNSQLVLVFVDVMAQVPEHH